MKEYTTFTEGQEVEVVFDYIVFIKDRIMTVKCLVEGVQVENANPHITILTNKSQQFEAKDSNDLLA
jgi:Fungal tRNA ligase phosphodiesterase domain